MVKIDRILFPVDLSGIGELIVPYVRLMAQCHQAQVQVLHVLEIYAGYNGLVEAHVDVEALAENMAETAGQRLARLVADDLAGLEVSTEVLQGRPAEKILACARDQGADLVIMASHARKGLDYAFFGSVAHKVARRAEIPVLLINPSGL
jgi:nucleotide-binding universal stress UspA family protein